MLKVYNTFEIVDWTLTDLRSVARLFSNNTGYHQRNGESVPSAADSHNGTGLAATRCVIAGYTKQCPDLLLFALGSSDRRKCEERYGTGKYNNLRSGQCRSLLYLTHGVFQCPSLQALGMCGCAFPTPETLTQLVRPSNMQLLRELHLGGCRSFHDDHLAQIDGQLPQLKVLPRSFRLVRNICVSCHIS